MQVQQLISTRQQTVKTVYTRERVGMKILNCGLSFLNRNQTLKKNCTTKSLFSVRSSYIYMCFQLILQCRSRCIGDLIHFIITEAQTGNRHMEEIIPFTVKLLSYQPQIPVACFVFIFLWKRFIFFFFSVHSTYFDLAHSWKSFFHLCEVRQLR